VSAEKLALAWAVGEAERAKFVEGLQGKIGLAHITTKKPGYEIGTSAALPLSFAKKKAPATNTAGMTSVSLGLVDCLFDDILL